MSQPQSPRSNFVQLMLLACTVFLGIQLISGGMNRPVESRTPAQIRENVVRMNFEGRDLAIQNEVRAYDSKLSEEVKAGRLTEEARRLKSIEAHVLSAQTSLRSGIYRNDYGKVNAAYTQMDMLRGQYGTQAVWQNAFNVAYHRDTLPQRTMSAAALYELSRSELSARNKKDLTMGIFPGYQIIDFLVRLTGSVPAFSYTFAAFLLALIVRAIVWPLAQKQLMFSRQMMQLQPLMKEIKEKHTKKGVTDNMAFQQDMMRLYSEYGIHPAKGCLPALAQMPLFLLVFQFMMHYRFEFEKGVFLWVNPASHATNTFFAPNLGKMDYLLLVVYALSMVAATYLQPVTDPANAKQQRVMGVVVSVVVAVSMFFFPLPSAFVLYWIFLNFFSMFQSWMAYRIELPPLQKVQTAHGGVTPKSGLFAKLMEAQQEQLRMQAELEKEKQKKQNKDMGKDSPDPNSQSNGKTTGQLYNPRSKKKKK